MVCFNIDDSWKLETTHNYTLADIQVNDFVDMSIKGAYFGSFLLSLKSILSHCVDIAILVLMIIDFPSIMNIILDGNGICDSVRYGAWVCSDDETSLSSVIPFGYRIGIIFASLLLTMVLILINWYKVFHFYFSLSRLLLFYNQKKSVAA